ncbi:MAG: FecR family protein [Bacteroidales bacterium]|nr:FecR family protein [Bacteroidales bacterium]
MDIELFRNYRIEDFVLDENFRKLAKGGEKSDYFLKELSEKIPEKRDEITLAVKIINELHTSSIQHNHDRKSALWNDLILKQKHARRFNILRYAATILLLVGIGCASILCIFKMAAPEKNIASDEVSLDDAALVLADGKQISINSEQSIIQYTSNGKNISVNDTVFMEQSITDDAVNQMITPYGKRSGILLSDGTKVWLNSGSRMIYPPVFKGKIREVYLEGEGYFEVAENSGKPFFVKTSAFTVKVIGTKFDVLARKQLSEFGAILLKGKITLMATSQSHSKEVTLSPDQKASFSDKQHNFMITEVENIENYIAWKDGYLMFNNEDISSVLKRVSQYYNISIDFRFKNDIVKISGKLDLKDDHKRVLDGLSIISKTKYSKEGNKYLFYN